MKIRVRSGRRTGRPIPDHRVNLQAACDFHDFVDFQLIADLEIVEILYGESELETRFHFADMVLEAFQRIEPTRMNHNIVPEYAYQRTSPHQTFEHIAARNGSDLGNFEDLTDFNQADNALLLLRSEHSGQCRFHFIHRFIDDVVVAKIQAVRGNQFSRSRIGTGVESDHDGIGGQGKIEIRFRNYAHTCLSLMDLDLCRG